MLKKCDLCGSLNHLKIYKPYNSKKNTIIKICKRCGLCFSKFGKKLNKISNLFGAAFGGLRSGKALLFEEFFNDFNEILKRKNFYKKKSNCLIVGGQNSNKFIHILKSYFFNIDIIEPDLRFFSKNFNKVKYTYDTFENFKARKKYDIIFLPHTLEHLQSPDYFFSKAKSILSENGLIYISVPDTAIISKYTPNITEFFLDKHKYHFTEKTLKNYLIKHNYKSLKCFKYSKNNIRRLSIILSKKKVKINKSKITNRYDETYKIIKIYKDNMRKDIKKLKNKFLLLDNYLSKKNVVAWAIGRIFTDYCMRGMKFKKFKLFIDSNYKSQKYLENFLKIKIMPPSHAFEEIANIDKIIVFSDAFYKQIIKNVSLKKYKKLFSTYTDLL